MAASTRELDIDAARILREQLHVIVVDEFGVAAAGVGEDAGESTARELDVSRAALASSKRSHLHAPGRRPLSGDEPDRRDVGLGLAEFVRDAHAIGHVGRRPTHVYWRAARALRDAALNDGDAHAASPEPVRERAPGDARPRNQGASSGHGCFLNHPAACSYC
jgi:hypothetical protein